MIEEEAVNLEDPGIYRQLDPEGMFEHLHSFPRLCRQAWRMALDFPLPPDHARINKIVILGMGGSAIGGDLVSSLSLPEAKAPVLVCRNYDLPRYVDAETLVIASSYSGQTEETLSAFKQAFDTPAKKLAITTGGKLKALCEAMSVPAFTFSYPTQPRAALPFSFLTILGILQQLGILPDKSGDVQETILNLDQMASQLHEKVPLAKNAAKALAHKLLGRLVLVYGAGITAEVAHRWKTQFNENSKTMAFYEVFPELDHNAIVGYSLPEEVTHQAVVVMLDSGLLPERVRLRYEITQKVLDQAGIYYQMVNGKGASALSQMLSLVLFGDYVSVYLALLNGMDPTPVKAIDFLKDNLSRS